MALLPVEGEVPAGEYLVPLGQAAVRRSGRDVTLVAYAKSVQACLQAAERLAGRGISAEVIDLRTIKPLDEQTVLGSVRKTGRLVVVHEASRICGVGAEVAALVAERAFASLRAPIVRLTGPDAPAAASFPLEQAFAPQPEAIEAAVLPLCKERASRRIEDAVAQ
jgi:pyruvate dehydrogenase E1 component beta subunit